MSVSNNVGFLGFPGGVRGRSQPDHQLVWQTSDGQSGILYEALLHAELVGAVGGKDADAAGTDLDAVRSAAGALHGKASTFRDVF